MENEIKNIIDEIDSHLRKKDDLRDYVAIDSKKGWLKVSKRLSHDKRPLRNRVLIYAGSVAAALILLYVGYHNIMLNNSIITEQDIIAQGILKDIHIISGKGTALPLNKDTVANENVVISYNSQEKAVSYTHLDSDSEVGYSTIVVPKGRSTKLILADNSVVYINAGSKLRFPHVFSDDERRVVLEGEAYFEVAKDESKPFIVEMGSSNIKVLGTKFNARNYSQTTTETILVEGSVEISINAHGKELQSVRISPNQICVVDFKTDSIDVHSVEVDKYISWVNGYLSCDNDSLEKLLDDLSRTYDVQFIVSEKEKIAITVSGVFNVKSQINNVLQLIEKSTGVKFIKDGERRYIIE